MVQHGLPLSNVGGLAYVTYIDLVVGAARPGVPPNIRWPWPSAPLAMVQPLKVAWWSGRARHNRVHDNWPPREGVCLAKDARAK